jgi:sulfur-oxidizing protein SoxY
MRPSRREFLIGSAGIGLVSALPAGSVSATPAMLEEAIRNVIGESILQKGKVTLDAPPLVENGNAVPVTIIVDSPMSEADHVKVIQVFNEKNPQPHVSRSRSGLVPARRGLRPGSNSPTRNASSLSPK